MDELRKNNLIQEYKDEIRWCKSALSSNNISEADKKDIQNRMERAERELASLTK